MSFPLRVGVVVVQNLDWPRWLARVRQVEALGYDAVYVWDHLVHRTQRRDDPLLDGLTVLAAAAQATTRIRLGTMVAAPIHRHPMVLANQAMTLDRISAGRLNLGIGAGGAVADHEVLGIPEWSPAERFERFRETVELVDAVLRGATSYEGEHYRGEGISIAPGPVQQPRPPLTLAAHGPKAMGVAGRYADTWNHVTTRDLEPDEVLALAADRGRTLDRAAEAAGRDPATIRRSVLIGSARWPALRSVEDFREAVLRYREVGVTEIVLLHPDHPAEAGVGHGEAAPGIVQAVAEALPDLRAELG